MKWWNTKDLLQHRLADNGNSGSYRRPLCNVCLERYDEYAWQKELGIEDDVISLKAWWEEVKGHLCVWIYNIITMEP